MTDLVWAPALIPIPLLGWFVPPLLCAAAVFSRRRRLERRQQKARRTPVFTRAAW
jgi:hypothetical protein